jgi:probable F420-dependent oxidoreductase
MKVITGVPAHDLSQVGAAAIAAQNRGFSGISTQENRQDPFLPLAVACTYADRLEIRTNIAIAFARSPMVAANLSWDLQRASKGRFVLGIGSQVKGHNVRRFSVPWSAPAPRMREYVQALRAIWDCWENGTKLDYQGEHYQFSLMTPNFTPDPMPCDSPKVQIAAVGPAMMKVAAQECDGVMLHAFCTRKYLDDVILPRLESGLEERGKSRRDFEISGGGFVVTGADDEAVNKMFEWVRMRVGFYGSTPSYWPVFESHGWEELGFKLNDMSKKGQWAQMTKEITDDVVHEFCAVGRYEQISAAIEQRFAGPIDVISLPADAPKDLVQDLADRQKKT